MESVRLSEGRKPSMLCHVEFTAVEFVEVLVSLEVATAAEVNFLLLLLEKKSGSCVHETSECT